MENELVACHANGWDSIASMTTRRTSVRPMAPNLNETFVESSEGRGAEADILIP